MLIAEGHLFWDRGASYGVVLQVPDGDEGGSASDEENNAVKYDGVGGSFDPEHVANLEKWVDLMTEELPELGSFILPTGGRAAAEMHVSRTVCRRAERLVVELVNEEVCDSEVLRYLNRLSDFFFTAARYVNEIEGRDEIQYKRHFKGATQRDRVIASRTESAGKK